MSIDRRAAMSGAIMVLGGLVVGELGVGGTVVYPPCPKGTPGSCRFRDSGAAYCTLFGVMPFETDRSGKFVGAMSPNPNECYGILACLTCGNTWSYSGSKSSRQYQIEPSIPK